MVKVSTVIIFTSDVFSNALLSFAKDSYSITQLITKFI